MEHFYHLPHMGEDYFTYPQLYSNIVAKFPSGSHFVELGGFKGKSTSYMAVEIINSGKNIKFDCVDLFIDCPQGAGEEIKATFIRNIEPVRHIVNLIIENSAKAAELYQDNSVDFVFIDADHSYEAVKKDIIAWMPKIKEGGILAGHDVYWPDVNKAVKELLPNITIHSDCYIGLKQ